MRVAHAPTFSQLLADTDILTALPRFASPSVQSVVGGANDEYYHWDKFRRRPLPEGLTARQAWLAIKFSRNASRRLLPFVDPDSHPFTYNLPDSSQHVLHLVDRHAGDLLTVSPSTGTTLKEIKEKVLVDAHMEEAIATSQIEGAVTTRVEARKMLKSGRGPVNKSEQMIVNGYRTIRLLSSHAQEPLTVELLHRIQRSMTEGTLDEPDHAGRFREPADGPVEIVDTRYDDVIYTPPPVEQVQDRMQRLIEFANDSHEDGRFMHPLVKASILHFWLAYEHPYNDGNGRTARALFYWYMLKNGFWLFEFLTISRVINDSRGKYYRAFVYTETDENDLTYFIQYMLKTTWTAIEELRLRIAKAAEQDARMRQIVVAGAFNRRQRSLLDHALQNPSAIFTFESHRISNNISLISARNDMIDLHRHGLLVEVGGQRPREFAPAPDLLNKIKQVPAARR